MASITIRNLDDALKERLRVRAARCGRSMEDEARDILRTALAGGRRASPSLIKALRRRFSEAGDLELDIPARDPMREPPRFKP
ncbi:MAG TPA: plasmid stabilization protein [Xanthomonadaceae bacterium]|nr:plasmid stabilization protein [Xanthomonadaceae bacterium]